MGVASCERSNEVRTHRARVTCLSVRSGESVSGWWDAPRVFAPSVHAFAVGRDSHTRRPRAWTRPRPPTPSPRARHKEWRSHDWAHCPVLSSTTAAGPNFPPALRLGYLPLAPYLHVSGSRSTLPSFYYGGVCVGVGAAPAAVRGVRPGPRRGRARLTAPAPLRAAAAAAPPPPRARRRHRTQATAAGAAPPQQDQGQHHHVHRKPHGFPLSRSGFSVVNSEL